MFILVAQGLSSRFLFKMSWDQISAGETSLMEFLGMFLVRLVTGLHGWAQLGR